ncbi:DUF6179 domain-containing protein [Bacillus haynesii]|nr:DUF6179 domain-containing protein [Bacillus haynesii]
MQILQRLIGQYTKGESTSVTTETAEGIMVSLMYAIDAYAFHFEKPEEVIVHLHSDSIKKYIPKVSNYFTVILKKLNNCIKT